MRSSEFKDKRGRTIQLGRAPIRIDILAGVPGIEFAAAWRRRVKGKFGNANASYASLDDLIVMKRAAGREQDIADVTALLQAKAAIGERGRRRKPRGATGR